MSKHELDEQVRAAAEAATAGPWQECGHDSGGCRCGQIWSTVDDAVPVAVVLKDSQSDDWMQALPTNWRENARFIALANPEYVLDLLARFSASSSKEDAQRTQLEILYATLDREGAITQRILRRIAELEAELKVYKDAE